MSHWRIEAFAQPVPQVFEAAAVAAAELGLGTSQIDRQGCHLYLSMGRRFGQRGWPLDLAVTDSGLGTTLVRVSWEQARGRRGLTGSPARTVGRLFAGIRRALEGEPSG